MEHIYLHTSKLENTKFIRNDPDFEKLPDYQNCYKKYHAHEYGRIKTQGNYYHIIVGDVLLENCAWCGCSLEFKKRERKYSGVALDLVKYIECFMKCNNCQSQGPVILVNSVMEIDEICMDEVQVRVKHAYIERRRWDESLDIEEIK